MKKLLCLMAFAILLFASTGWTATLVSDPTPEEDQVTMFNLFFDGGTAIETVPVNRAIQYDMSGIADGSHVVKAQACNVWRCSDDSVPLVFTKKIPGVPVFLRIAP